MQAAEIFHAQPEYFDWEAQRFILADKRHTALEFEQVRYVSSVQDSKELVEGARQVEILGKTYPVKAEVARLEGLSAGERRQERGSTASPPRYPSPAGDFQSDRNAGRRGEEEQVGPGNAGVAAPRTAPGSGKAMPSDAGTWVGEAVLGDAVG